MNMVFTLCASVLNLISHSQTPLFADYYAVADVKLAEMTTDQKIAQTLLVRYPDDSTAAQVLKEYQFGGYLLFAKDFQGKTASEVRAMVDGLQKVAKVPILTAVDEEGGLVVRVSSNPLLRASRFPSPSELYRSGDFTKIREDTIEKSRLLASLGLNLNLAPVVDVSTNPSDYMFGRSLGEDAEITSEFAKAVIEASHTANAEIIAENTNNADDSANTSISNMTHPTVSYTLKHFPGYGNNSDTHQGTSVDSRSLLDLLRGDLLPFRAGINVGAEAVLVSHNIVTAVDPARPASLSPAVHELLTVVLGFTGVIITDDIAMGAITDPSVSSASEDPAVQAVLAGNHLIITTDYSGSLSAIKSALSRGVLAEAQIDQMARQVLAWKAYKGLL